MEFLALIAFAGVRVATGLFFAISGYHKIFNPARHQSLVDTLATDGIPVPRYSAWLVAISEFVFGITLVVGLLTQLSALVLLVICTVATAVDGLKRVRGMHPIDRADLVDDLLYLPEVTYILLLILFVTNGGSALSIDALIFP